MKISYAERLDNEAIKKDDIKALRNRLYIGQRIKVLVQSVYGQAIAKKLRTYKGRITGIDKHFITVDVGNWKTCFTYAELLQSKTEVSYYD